MGKCGGVFYAVVVILVDQFPLEMAILVALNNFFFGDNRYWVYLCGRFRAGDSL